MQVFRRFKADQRGATATLFGLSVIPVLGLIGAAMDYSRAAGFHSRLQLAADSTALAMVREPAYRTPSQINAKGEQYLADTLRQDPAATVSSVVTTRDGKKVTVAATASMKRTIMQLLGVQPMPISVTSQASSMRRLEVALVLDNTYSMSDPVSSTIKMKALKDEVTNALTTLKKLALEPGRGQDSVKVSIVPFDTEVRLDAAKFRNENWFRYDHDRSMTPSDWSGYVYDRHGTYAHDDRQPSGVQDSLFPALRASECKQNGAMGCPSSADLPAIQPLVSITENFDSLTRLVGSMQPRGYTNIALGAVWGQATLSRSKPFTEGAEANDESVQKVMLVVTDGKNTAHHRNGVIENSTWLEKDRPTEAQAIVDRIDANTRGACQSAKDAKIEVFTIRLLEGDEKLLRSCASDPASNYSDAQTPSQLRDAFQNFLDRITRTRVIS